MFRWPGATVDESGLKPCRGETVYYKGELKIGELKRKCQVNCVCLRR